MKFPDFEKLRNFVKTELFPLEYKNVREIYTGGSTYNFCIETINKKYFLKLISNQKDIDKIKKICELSNPLDQTKIKDFLNYKTLVMPYIEGQKIRYKDCTPLLLNKLFSAYRAALSDQKIKEIANPEINISLLCDELKELVAASKKNIFRFLYQKFLKNIEKQLVSFPESQTLIHGDFTANNVLIAKDGQPYILDWAKLQYGNVAEDAASLTLELSGFRKLFGNLKRFKKLFLRTNTILNLTTKEWLYGVQIFYLGLLKRRLNQSQKQSLRKQFCAWLIMLGYFRIYHFLEKN